MTNNLVFKDGTMFPICDAPAKDAPNMLGGGWEWFHVEGVCADVCAALENGLSHREFDRLKGVGENGEYETEILTEDLSDFVVNGSVVDHRDGTVTLWVRRLSDAEKAEAQTAEYAENLLALGVDV